MNRFTVISLLLACPSPVLSQGASKGALGTDSAKSVTIEALFGKSKNDEVVFIRDAVMEDRNSFLLHLRRGGGVTMELKRASKMLESLEGQWRINDKLVTITVPETTGKLQHEIIANSESYFLVPWGKRTYLILKDDIYSFCSAVNQGTRQWRFRESAYLVKKSGQRSRLKSRPDVPKQYKDYLLKSPIEGKVIEDLGNFRFRINRGHKDGIRPKMQLFGFVDEKAADSISMPADLEVIEVKDATSIVEDQGSKLEAELRADGEPGDDPEVLDLLVVKLRVGSRVSTSDGTEELIKELGG